MYSTVVPRKRRFFCWPNKQPIEIGRGKIQTRKFLCAIKPKAKNSILYTHTGINHFHLLVQTFCWKMRNLIINLYNLIYKRQSCSLFCTIPFRGPAGSYSTYMASVCMAFYRVVGQVEGGFVRLMKKKIKRDDVLRLGELMNVHPKEPPRPHSLIAD